MHSVIPSIDHRRVLRNLSRNLEDGKLTKSGYEEINYRPSFLFDNQWRGTRFRQVDSRGRIRFGTFDGEKVRVIGSLYLQSGDVTLLGPERQSTKCYNELIFRIGQPLHFQDGRELPPCSVSLYVEGDFYRRRNSVPLFANGQLNSLLPTEWFFADGDVPEKLPPFLQRLKARTHQ